jgi:hypothetical protein
MASLTKAGGRRQEAGGCFCNGDLCPAPKTFRLKRRGFRPDFFDKPGKQNHICVTCGRQFIDNYEKQKGYDEKTQKECLTI